MSEITPIATIDLTNDDLVDLVRTRFRNMVPELWRYPLWEVQITKEIGRVRIEVTGVVDPRAAS